MEPLLARLAAAGVPMHAFSNYPAWWRLIEGKLGLSRYLEWTFVSCHGPLRVGGLVLLACTVPAGGARGEAVQ